MTESCFDRALRETCQELDAVKDHSCVAETGVTFDWQEAERLALDPEAVRKWWPPKACPQCGKLTYASKLHMLYATD